MKNNIYLVFAIFGTILGVCGGDTSDYPYSLYLDRQQQLQLSWRVDYANSRVYFHVEAVVDVGEWFAVGFSDYGEAHNADFAVFWTNKRGIHHFQDSHTDDEGALHVDIHQDYDLSVAYSTPTSTILEFHRRIDTCDDEDYLFDTGTTHILSFISKNAVTSLNNVNVTSMSPTVQRVQLLKPDIQPPPFPADVSTFEVTTPNIEVPAQETTYWWYTAKLPPLTHKHHIIQYEGAIQKGHEGLVHHMELFHCEVAPNEIIRSYNGPGQSEGKPAELEACRHVIGAWAMGATSMSFPKEAGIPIGGADFSRYVMLEVHYNNPQKLAGEIDASGIRFYMTADLRKYDAGIMEFGLEYTNKMAIPPRQKIFPLTGDCIAECTAVGLPPSGINIFASQLHTHLTGRKVFTRHVRNGVELPEVNRDNHYSPHFQEIRALPKPVHIRPGDALVTTCQDSTLDKDNVTIGGFAISDEMCVNYVHYYPRVNLEVCKSSIDTDILTNYFRFMNKWDLDPTSAGKGDRANWNAIRWTPMNSLLLRVMYDTSPISMQCNQSDGTRFPGYWENMPLTKIIKPLDPPIRECPELELF